MKKKFWSFLSVVLLVSTSLIGTVQVFADTNESDQSQEQESQTTNEVEASDSEENANETENNESSITSGNSLEEIDKEESIPTVEEYKTREDLVDTNDNIATGTVGSATWRIDKDGTLHIESGIFPDRTSDSGPWMKYKDSIKKISFEGRVVAGTRIYGLFSYLSNVVEIENLNYLDTTNVQIMSNMFYGMRSLKTVDLTGFNTSNVINMRNMFNKASSLTSLDLSSFDTSNVTSMAYMFSYMTNLVDLNLSSFDTSKVIDMTNMFSSASSLTSLDLSSFDTKKVTAMQGMFFGTKSLNHLTLGKETVLLGDGEIPEPINGKWVHVDSDATFSSIQLMQYDGSLAGLYQWAVEPQIEVIDSNIYVGDLWTPYDNFILGTNHSGNELNFDIIKVEGTV
ncbi:BspA family leucine-rich repeat surface protein, partial [Enterococcus faecalis]|nr:BspA family leucine-rich repeat surface protein [Enterococcus faecalis]